MMEVKESVAREVGRAQSQEPPGGTDPTTTQLPLDMSSRELVQGLTELVGGVPDLVASGFEEAGEEPMDSDLPLAELARGIN